MSMGEEVVSAYLRSKMSSILEDVQDDPGCPSSIVSRFRSLEEQIKSRESSAPASVCVDLLYKLIEALSECRVRSYERLTLTAKKGFVFNFLRIHYLFRIHYRVSDSMFNRSMKNRLKVIKDKLETADSEAARPRAPAAGVVIEQTYPIQDHSLIIGFEKQVGQIEAWLMPRPRPSTSNKEEEIEEEEEEERRDIGIGIVGEWGCGKTALAQKVFTSPRIQEEFSPRIWVCLSNMEMQDDDDELNKILKEVGHDLELEGKRYLIVLDDARQLPRDRESLILNHCLPKGSGGAVIVTSRREKVVTHMFDDAKPHLHFIIRLNPGHLTDDICWQIFSKQLQLLGKMLPNHLLSTIQEDVKTKSKGQPLAAKTLANILPDFLSKPKSNWIAARDLIIYWGDDGRYWRWTSLPPPEEMEEVAELLRVCWLEIKGSLELNETALKTTYSAYLVFKLNDKYCNLDRYQPTARVRIVSDGKDAKGVQELERRVLIFLNNVQGEEGGYFPQAGGTGWMEIKLGEFFSGHGRLVEVIIEDKNGNWKRGLIVKGIDFRPIL